MRIAIIGYGKMGKVIENLAHEKGHEIVAKIKSSNFTKQDLHNAEVAIEFTKPESAVQNIKQCVNLNLPVVVGTTGWYSAYNEVQQYVLDNGGCLFTATNFSIGVNVLFHLNEKLSNIMNQFENYDVRLDETHHIHKKDHPSGTAVTLAEGVIKNLDRKNAYFGLLEGQKESDNPFDLQVLSKRENEVPGYHKVTYTSDIDELSISHNAFGREGFASGSIVAAEWLAGKQGVFGMKDLLKFE